MGGEQEVIETGIGDEGVPYAETSRAKLITARRRIRALSVALDLELDSCMADAINCWCDAVRAKVHA